MKTQTYPGAPLVASRIAFGCMRFPPDRVGVIKAVRAALDEGINLFDNADVYQAGRAEEAFAAMWGEVPGLRDKIILQTKCGIRRGEPTPQSPTRYDFSYEHIIEAVNASLKRLQTDHIDILLLHRPDPLVEPEDVARAFDEVHTAGKVRYFGVSNHTGAQIDLLKTAVTQPLIANQLEISIWHPTLILAGVITNQDQPPYPVRGEGTLEYCRLHKMTVQAWGPLAAGRLTGRRLDQSDERAVKAAATVREMASAHGVSPEAIMLAWLLKHPAKIQPIIGSMNPQRIKDACKADGVELTREEWYTLFAAGRGSAMP
jgi:predicted oxidoreductase